MSEGGFGQRILLVFSDHTQLRCDDGNGRTRDREVSKEELDKLREWILANKIDQLPRYDEGAADGVRYQYVHLLRKGGAWRVFMNNPPAVPIARTGEFFSDRPPASNLYGELTGRILKLDQTSMRVSYESLQHLEGFKVIHPKEKAEVSTFSIRDNWRAASVFLKTSTSSPGIPYRIPAFLKRHSQGTRWS